MSRLVILIFLILSIVSSPAKEFTSSDGRKVVGDLLAHAGDQVIMKVGAREFVIPIAGFSVDDQQFIKDWIEQNPDAVRYKFGFFFDLEKMREDVTQGKAPGGMVDDKLKTIPYTYELIVFNREVADVSDVEIRYEIYIDDFVDIRKNKFTSMATGSTPSARLETVAGRFERENIPAGGRVDFSRTFNTEFYIDRDGGRLDEAAEDKVLGVRVRVYKDGKLIAEDIEEEPSTRGLEQISWQDEPGTEGTVVED